MEKIKYEPEKCECCGQSKTYIIGLDHGTADTVRAIALMIGRKGLNMVHPRKELEGRGISSNQVGNLSKARFHGLIAAVKGERGNYLLTKKGAAFLRNQKVAKYAIISKAEGKQIGYFNPEENMTCISELLDGTEYWEGVNFEIIEGRVVWDEFVQIPLL